MYGQPKETNRQSYTATLEEEQICGTALRLQSLMRTCTSASGEDSNRCSRFQTYEPYLWSRQHQNHQNQHSSLKPTGRPRQISQEHSKGVSKYESNAQWTVDPQHESRASNPSHLPGSIIYIYSFMDTCMNHDGFICVPRQYGVSFFAVAPSPAQVSRLRTVQLHTSRCQPRCLQLAASTSLRHGTSSLCSGSTQTDNHFFQRLRLLGRLQVAASRRRSTAPTTLLAVYLHLPVQQRARMQERTSR